VRTNNQCEYRFISMGRRQLGQRCRRIARWHLYSKMAEGGMKVCQKHRDEMLARADLGVEPLPTKSRIADIVPQRIQPRRQLPHRQHSIA
jgi:hypothetical protein